MNPDLTERFNQMVEILKKDLRCKGGWHYGSYGRGLSDNYSDYDPVFLISDQYFNEFDPGAPRSLSWKRSFGLVDVLVGGRLLECSGA